MWDDVAYFFDPDLMASLPEVRVPDTSMEDWQAALDLVGESGWKCQYSEGGAVLPASRAKGALSRPADAECPELRVCLPPRCWRSSASMRRRRSTSMLICGSCRARSGSIAIGSPAATAPGTTSGRPPRASCATSRGYPLSPTEPLRLRPGSCSSRVLCGLVT